ncbi:MAG: M10 family metallopeptidase C-terminal domain-containing protein [Asticcacaulis sp.]|nr:M10 family metallopeptidase C-terminal domain-containing protein [Asticcacaulis sp.]
MSTFPGTTGDDTLSGTPYDDIIMGGDGNDLLNGNSGFDTVTGDAGRDNIHGGAGIDSLDGGDGNDIIRGEAGVDRILGRAGQDKLFGGDGNDTIIGGAGHDWLYGGTGNDTFTYEALTDSTHDDIDVIEDFEHGKDKIDLTAFNYTGFTEGHAAPHQLRLAYSAASDRTYLRDDYSDFEIALKGDYRGILTADDIRFAPGGKVGYYEAGTGYGSPEYSVPITNLGYTPVSLNKLTTTELRSGLDAVFLLNQTVGGYKPELLGAASKLANYVAAGGVLVIFDNNVAGAQAILPGLPGISFVSEGGDDVNFVNDYGVMANGSGGHFTDTSLDHAYYSDAGYALDSSLPANVVRIQTTEDPTHVVTFAYAYGSGAVVYSTLFATAFLPLHNPSDVDANINAFTESVLSWAVSDHHDLFLL